MTVARLALFMLVLSAALHADTTVSRTPADESRPVEESWVKKRKHLLIAGGALLAAGGVLWAYLGSISTESRDRPKSRPLGNPPQDPVIQGSR